MNMETTKPRRSPQPAIDLALIVPGAEFAKNRARDVGQPPILVIVEAVQTIADVPTVFYRYKVNGKRRNMPLEAFCQGSEHRLPDPEPVAPEPVEEAPQSGERLARQAETLEEQVFRLGLESDEHTKMLLEIRSQLRKLCGPAQLELTVAR